MMMTTVAAVLTLDICDVKLFQARGEAGQITFLCKILFWICVKRHAHSVSDVSAAQQVCSQINSNGSDSTHQRRQPARLVMMYRRVGVNPANQYEQV